MRHRHVVQSLLALLLATSPAAAETAPAPTVLGAPVVIELEGDATEADVHLVLGNDGGGGRVTLQFMDTRTGRPIDVRLLKDGQFGSSVGVDLAAYASTPVDLQVRTDLSTVTGHLVVQPVTGKAATASFATKRHPAAGWMALTLLGFVVALIAVVVTWLAPSGDQARPKKPVRVAASWSFSSSWAANATGIAAVLGTVLAATAFVGDVLPGVSTTWFVGMNIFYGTVVVAAGAAFRLLAYFVDNDAGDDDVNIVGSVAGFVVGAWLVLSAALGQIGVLFFMTHMSDGGWVGLAVQAGLVVAALLVLTYVVVSTHGTITKPEPKTASAGQPPTRAAALV